MIVFVVNCGSSSIKYQLINMEGEKVMAKGLVERIGMEGSTLKHTPVGKYTIDLKEDIPDHVVGIKMVLKALTSKDYGVIKDMSEIDAVGHRVVHGGERFADSVLITGEELNETEMEVTIAKRYMSMFERGVVSPGHLEEMEDRMLKAACEAIQTAAMCRKWILSLDRMKPNER